MISMPYEFTEHLEQMMIIKESLLSLQQRLVNPESIQLVKEALEAIVKLESLPNPYTHSQS